MTIRPTCWALLLWFAGLPATAGAAGQEQTLLPAQSEIVFVSKQMGVPVAGRFTKFDARIRFDPAHPQASRISFSVETGSASLGVPEADAELPKPVWFDVPGFPRATFESSQVKALGAMRFEVTGRLSIKGHSQTVTLPVALTQSGAITLVTGSFVLKRLAYAIGEAQWSDTDMVADEVQVSFRLALTGVGRL